MNIRNILRLLIILILIPPFIFAQQALAEKFIFAHISDTHIRTEKAINDYKSVLNRIKELSPKISFVVNTGDVTDYGYAEEFSEYNKATKEIMPDWRFYVTSGNHDTRWSNRGKQNFRKFIGEANSSFDYGGVHFVLLDSSMLVEQYGHLEQKDLVWLKGDLQRQQPDKPIIIALHHPPFLENLFVDNEYEFLQTIEPFNVVLVLAGHIHQNKDWRRNGTQFVATQASLDQQGFRLVEITSQSLTLFTGDTKNKELKKDFTISLKKLAPPEIKISPIDSQTSYTVVVTAPEFANVSFALDFDQEFKALNKIRQGVFAEQLPYRELCPGVHRAVLKLNSEKYGEWRKAVKFNIDDKKVKIAFTVAANGTIQSSPVASREHIFFGANDGNIYCINSARGEIIWKYKTGAEVLATPAIDEETVYVGSLEGNFYALSATDGKLKWRYSVGAPVLASALVVSDKVFFGAGDFKMRALNRKDGKLLWEFSTGRLIKMRPAFTEGKLLFGSWDGYFYCLSADDGKLLWKKQISDSFLFAPATSNPIIADKKVIFVAHNYVTHCLDIESGEELWNYPDTEQTRPSYNSGAYFDQAVFYGSITGHLVSFNVADGKLRFATPLKFFNSLDPVFDSSPAIYKGVAFVGSIGGFIYGVDCQTGELKWQFSLQDGYIFSSPVISEGRLFIGTSNGKLYAIDLDLKTR